MVVCDAAQLSSILELRLANGDFVRFDLNGPEHDNEQHGMRSHMHINSDDDGMSVPAAVMTPFELLGIMVHGLTRTGRQRHVAKQLSKQSP